MEVGGGGGKDLISLSYSSCTFQQKTQDDTPDTAAWILNQLETHTCTKQRESK